MIDDSRTMQVLIVADEAKQMETLRRVLSQKGKYSFTQADQTTLPDSLATYDAVIMFLHKVLTDRTQKVLIRYATEGGRILVIHHGISSVKRVVNNDWLHFLGIHIEPKDAPVDPWRVAVDVTHTVVNLRPDHFITTNNVQYDRMVEYKSSDFPTIPGQFPALDLPQTEVFLNQYFTDGRAKTVLFGFRCEDTVSGKTVFQDRCGWIKHTGRGMVIYLQPGHKPEDFEHQAYAQILHNSLVWTGVDERLPPVSVEQYGRNGFFETDPHGWREIVFDAKHTGWKEYGWPPGSPEIAGGETSAWEVADDGRTLRTSGSPHTHLLSDTEYADFILHVEWRYSPTPGSLNSGLFVRMRPGEHVMHQIETLMSRVGIIMGGAIRGGTLTPIVASVPDGNGRWTTTENHTSNGWFPKIERIAMVDSPKVPQWYGQSEPNRVNQPGEWNTYEICCVDTRIVVWLNRRIASYTDKCTIPKGSIGFEAEGHPIEFRNIRVKVIG